MKKISSQMPWLSAEYLGELVCSSYSEQWKDGWRERQGLHIYIYSIVLWKQYF